MKRNRVAKLSLRTCASLSDCAIYTAKNMCKAFNARLMKVCTTGHPPKIRAKPDEGLYHWPSIDAEADAYDDLTPSRDSAEFSQVLHMLRCISLET